MSDQSLPCAHTSLSSTTPPNGSWNRVTPEAHSSTSYSSPLRAGIRGVISGRSWDLFQGWSSYATQYNSIASYYVGQAALAP